MSIAPRFLGHKYVVGVSEVTAATSRAPHTIDVYLDYVCPFSKKMFNTVYSSVIPAAETKYAPGTFTFVFRNQIQPWHPSSTLVHEASLAVEKLAPEAFWAFSKALFDASAEYYDTEVYYESRNKTYERLAELAVKSAGIDKDEFLDLVGIPPSTDGTPSNIGNKITNDLKVFVRQSRKSGIHVSPTVLVDGIENGAISSGWTTEQWIELLDSLAKES
ncbi:thioredoxin-like protein [Lipomyces oligophaga]|uniref:thioredoxin-like protein n=1 Tax=Lipomyces oligophaga TaxID=45792 RepID=UPI0034CE0920